MISTAFKPDAEINTFTPTWFSTHPTLEHFRDAIARPYFWDVVKNSLIVVGAVVALSMVVAFLAAVALAKYRFTGNKLFVVLVIGILMLPQAGLVIPLYVVLAKYHLTNAPAGPRVHAPRRSCCRSPCGRFAGSSWASRRSSRRRRWSTARAGWARSPGSCFRSSRRGSWRPPCSCSSRAGTSTSSPTSSSRTRQTRR